MAKNIQRLGSKEAERLYARLAAVDPAPKTELDYLNPFTLLVAVVLSAQATDAGVNKATGPLFAIANTPEKMTALGEARLGEMIRTIGLWRGKAKNVVALSKLLIERHGGEVPRTREELEVLPGVGRKTANVVLNAAFGEPTLAVDTHVFRVANRTGLAPGKTPLAVEEGLLKITPAKSLQHAHHWLILHGRYVCVARKPKCPECKISDICLFAEKTAAFAPRSPQGLPPSLLRRGGAGGEKGRESRPRDSIAASKAGGRKTTKAAHASPLPPYPPSLREGGRPRVESGAGSERPVRASSNKSRARRR